MRRRIEFFTFDGKNLISNISGEPMSEPPADQFSYWVSYELRNGMIRTWEDYAPSVDAFIEQTIQHEIKREGKLHIKRFDELHEHSTGTFGGKKISIQKYNKELKTRPDYKRS